MKKFLLVFFIIFLLGIKSAEAADLKLTCKYNAGVIPFDDISVELTYKVYSDDSIDLAFSKNDKLASGYDWEWQHAIGFSGNFVYYAKEGGGYQCPDINTFYDMGFITVDIGDIVDEAHKKATLVEEKIEGDDPEDPVTITKTCVYKLFNDIDNKLDFTLDVVKLEMDSKGVKYIYVNDHKDDVDGYVSEIIDSRYGTIADFEVKDEEISKLFVQDSNQQKDNTFSCPTTIYVDEDYFTDRKYSISTTDSDYKYYMRLYDEATYDPGDIVIDPITGEPIDCSDFVTKDGINIISDIFNIIMIIGPILALVLGGVDFAKATLASDENALKKAGSNFGKRIIAAILLFLIPLVINLIFSLAFDAGVFGTMKEVPSVCLTKK